MTDTGSMLPTGFATVIDGAAALVVGFVHGFLRHPSPGSPVRPFVDADTSAMATGVIGVPLYALVSVEWAAESKGSLVESGRAAAKAQGATTWYLHPVDYVAELSIYVLDTERRYAASGRAAEIPTQARQAVREWGFGGRAGVPARVWVHNHRV